MLKIICIWFYSLQKNLMKSDIDFIVKFHQLDLSKYADNYFDLKFSLEEILKREIDLLEEKSIKPIFLK